MWQVVNRTPFKAAGAFERDAQGRESWVVAVRGTFDLGVGGAILALSETQADVRQAPVYLDDDTGELRGESDIMGFLPGTDVTLHGTIAAPPRAVLALDLGLKVGTIDKRASLFGPRTARRRLIGWRQEDEGQVGATEISWRNSFGGTGVGDDPVWCRENPLGLGIGLWEKGANRPEGPIPLPLFETANDTVLDRPAGARPIGFGPVPRHWEPRKSRAGTYDRAWEKSRAPLLPTDFQPTFYNAAPDDQVATGHLKGGEPFGLEGFLGAPCTGRLPQVILTAHTRLSGQGQVETRFTLCRVEFDLDARTVQMCWVTTLSVRGDDSTIEKTTVRVRQMSGVAT